MKSFRRGTAWFLLFILTPWLTQARIFRKKTIDKEKVIQNRDIRLKKSDKTFKGDLFFKPFYYLHIYKIKSELPAEKAYLGRITESIITDDLRVIKKVFIPSAYPELIRYPYPGNRREDPREAFMQNQKTPRYFPLVINKRPYHIEKLEEYEEIILEKRKKDLAKGIRKPEEVEEKLEDDELLGLERVDSYHLAMAIEAISKDEFEVKVEVFWEEKSLFKDSYVVTEENSGEELDKISEELRRVLCGEKWANLNVTSNLSKTSVYIDDKFIGKTPLQFRYLPATDYNLTLRADGYAEYHEEIILENRQTFALQGKMQLLKTEGAVEVITDPPGAKIYIGLDYKGKSPMKVQNLPYGSHRVKVMKENHVQRYQSVNITEEEPLAQVRLQLPEGDFQKYYEINPRVIGPFTYKDFSYIGLGLSVLSFTGYIVYAVKSDESSEAAQSHSESQGANADASYIAANNADAEAFSSLSSVFLIGAITTLAAAGYFYYLFLKSYDLDIAKAIPARPPTMLAANLDGWKLNVNHRALNERGPERSRLEMSMQRRF